MIISKVLICLKKFKQNDSIRWVTQGKFIKENPLGIWLTQALPLKRQSSSNMEAFLNSIS